MAGFTDPDDADASLDLGIALAEQGRHGEAIAPLRDAVAARPLDAEVHLRLGVSLEALGESFLTMSSLREALTLRPGLRAAEALLVLCCYRKCYRFTGHQRAESQPRSGVAARRVAVIGHGEGILDPVRLTLNQESDSALGKCVGKFGAQRTQTGATRSKCECA